MNLKFGLLCFLFCSSCMPKNKTQIFNKNNVQDFKLINAKYENWVAGYYGGGSGVEYYINAVVNTKEKILFDSLWVNKYAYKVFITKEQKTINDKKIEYNYVDTITIRVSYLSNNNQMNTSNPPINFSGTGLLSYRKNEITNYFIINEFEKIISPNRQ